jgi:hypothetical protein
VSLVLGTRPPKGPIHCTYPFFLYLRERPDIAQAFTYKNGKPVVGSTVLNPTWLYRDLRMASPVTLCLNVGLRSNIENPSAIDAIYAQVRMSFDDQSAKLSCYSAARPFDIKSAGDVQAWAKRFPTYVTTFRVT